MKLLMENWRKHLKEARGTPIEKALGLKRPPGHDPDPENWWIQKLSDTFMHMRETYNAIAGWSGDREHIEKTGGAGRAPSEKQKQFLEIFKLNSKMFIHDMEENLGITPSDLAGADSFIDDKELAHRDTGKEGEPTEEVSSEETEEDL